MLNPDGVDAARIQQGSSLSKDAFQNDKFHYLIANPPYGKNWDMDKKDVTAEHAEGERGRFAPGLPRSSDGQMLFMLSLLSKMRPVSKGGSRVAIVMNGSPLLQEMQTVESQKFADTSSKTIFSKHWLQFLSKSSTTLVLPLHLDSNQPKSRPQKGQVQLIDASGEDFWKPMRKSLGDKRREMDESHIAKVLETYHAYEDNTDVSKVYPNSYFGYRKVTVDRPTIECSNKCRTYGSSRE